MVGDVPLRAWREYKGLSMRELATASGVGISTLVRVEHGMPTQPRTRRRLAEALGITHEELLSDPPARRVAAR